MTDGEITIGIDPGQKGGIAILLRRNMTTVGNGFAWELLGVHPMPLVGKEPGLDAIVEWIWRAGWLGQGSDGKNWHAWIEDAQAMRRPRPGATACPACGSLPATQGVVATATFVGGARLIEGCLRGMGIECTRIKAQEWQKIMLGPKRPRGRVPLKLASIRKARGMFPEVNFKRTARCTTYSDGMTDAALIAAYGSRMDGQ